MQRLAAACRTGDRQRALPELWALLNTCLARYLAREQRRHGTIDREDLLDIASEKTLELLSGLDGGRWDPESCGAPQLQALLATVARNGLIDHLRVNGPSRRRDLPPEWVHSLEDPVPDQPHAALERRRVARQLHSCAGRLTPRARRIWVLRVFLELSSKEIAGHPEVRSRPAAVDMTLTRARRAIRDCMRSHGHDTMSLPRGSFSALWELFVSGRREGGRP